jgi:hypothetical protein
MTRRPEPAWRPKVMIIATVRILWGLAGWNPTGYELLC